MHRFLLGVIVAFAVFTYAHGDCESHKRSFQSSDHVMKWNIQCDSEGNYLPLQCTEDGTWCSCYSKTEAITSPSRNTRTCVCPLAHDNEAENDAENTASCIPPCDPAKTGKFVVKHCCNGTCYCFDPNTGERSEENSQSATSIGDLQCPEN